MWREPFFVVVMDFPGEPTERREEQLARLAVGSRDLLAINYQASAARRCFPTCNEKRRGGLWVTDRPIFGMPPP